ncbi:trimethoprim-resistant dihydrofolate reductase DfrA, partial [Morganella morganii]
AVGRCLMLWSSNDVTQQGSRPKTKLSPSGGCVKLSLIAAKSLNGVIGNGLCIPWKTKGEQLIFKAMTYNQWLLVGRKTFESMGVLPNRKYAVVSQSGFTAKNENVIVFPSIEAALKELDSYTNHVLIAGGGQIYNHCINMVDTIHISTIHKTIEGDVRFPEIPSFFKCVFNQHFESNINYTYEIFMKEQ